MYFYFIVQVMALNWDKGLFLSSSHYYRQSIISEIELYAILVPCSRCRLFRVQPFASFCLDLSIRDVFQIIFTVILRCLFMIIITIIIIIIISNVRELSLFYACPSNKHCPSARRAYADGVVGKDLDIFALGAVSLYDIYAEIVKLLLLLCFLFVIIIPFHICLFICLFVFCNYVLLQYILESVYYVVMYICTVLCL
jgi:hypothetical protein